VNKIAYVDGDADADASRDHLLESHSNKENTTFDGVRHSGDGAGQN
jgi:hypothetical protein